MADSSQPVVDGDRPPWHVRIADRFGAERTARFVDAALALGCFVLFTGPLLVGAVDRQGPLPAQALLGVLAAAPVAVRRRRPVGVLVTISVVLAVAPLLGVQFTPFVSDAGPALPIAVYTVAVAHPRRLSAAVTVAAVLAATVGALVAYVLRPDIDQNAVQLALAIPAWLIGDAVRTGRDYRRRVAEQEQLAAAEQRRRLRAEEHVRLSREVHDVVSHGLSMIAVQAGTGRMVFDARPDQARQALATIEVASRAALTDLRGLLRDIRDSGSGGGSGTGLADLSALVARIGDDGVIAVTLTEDGVPRDYPPAVDLSGYRIVQEAVTNAVKHAPGAAVRIELSHRPSELILTVSDDGGSAPAVPLAGSGLGLAGIRERADLLGGEVVAGPNDDGGFTVSARLPVADQAAGA